MNRRARLGAGSALGLVLGLLAVVNITRSTAVPTTAHLALNLALAAIVVCLGWRAELDATELGLARARAAAGARLGLAAVGLVAAVVAAAALLPATSDAFRDDRGDVTLGVLAVRVLVVIPLGTVVVEELVFRGVVQGLLSRVVAPSAVLAIGAVIFGLWHVFPAWHGESDSSTGARLGLAAGTFAATTMAGVVFGWLRARSGSLVAPALAHWATNSFALIAAWAVAL